jgi:IclR family KDG regulon transcriptional repressor
VKTTQKRLLTRNWEKTPGGKRSIPTVRKAFAILELLCSNARPYSVSEISKIFRLPMSSSSTLLNTLEQCGYLKRDKQRQFSLTLKMLSDGTKALNQVPLRDVAEPELKRLTEATGLGSIISVLDGYDLVCIHKIEGPSDIRIASYVGKRSPLHATATGKAILSRLPAEEVERIVGVTGLGAFTPKTITTFPKLQKELKLVRKQGYAIDDEEHGIGIKGIAAVTFDFQGKAIAAVGIGGAIFELDARDDELIQAVKLCASRISAAIGFPVEQSS